MFFTLQSKARVLYRSEQKNPLDGSIFEPACTPFLNVPEISPVEWHPFTLTSTPDDDYIEFHFAPVGDWTTSVQEYLAEQLAKGKENSDEEEDIVGNNESALTAASPLSLNLQFKVDGPIGASSQGFADYPMVVLIGAGIGITPMVSVVRYLLDHPGRMKKTYFYWTSRGSHGL